MNKNGGKRIKMSLYTVGTLFRKGSKIMKWKDSAETGSPKQSKQTLSVRFLFGVYKNCKFS